MMKRKIAHNQLYQLAAICLIVITLTGCSSQSNFTASTKYSAQQLQQDFDIAWDIYKQNHPSYDWYAPSESVDLRFEKVRNSLTDSLTESEFRARMSFALAGIHCGHTTVMASKAYRKYSARSVEPIFPLQVKVWGNDSMVVLQSLLSDSFPLRRGTVITSINQIPISVFVLQMKEYASTDGFSDGFKEIQIGAGFAPRFKWMYGLPEKYSIGYIDTTGNANSVVIPNFFPKKRDSLPNLRLPTPDSLKPGKRPAKKFRNTGASSLKLDTANSTALMTINSFSEKKQPGFIRKSFRTLRQNNIENLIIELRANGGGKISNSTLLTRYIVDQPFTVADSVSAKSLKLMYPQYIQASWFYRLLSWTFVKKQSDGRYHLGQTERERFRPKKRYHFKGDVYAITGGATFSASTLFLGKIMHQPNVTLVGEETGGGARGNSAVMTPRVTLPNTKVRVRLPLFRLVADASLPHNGRGIMPDVEVPPSSYYIGKDVDPKMEKVMELIKDKSKNNKTN